MNPLTYPMQEQLILDLPSSRKSALWQCGYSGGQIFGEILSMFTTGHHLYLTISVVGYAMGLILFITKNDRMAHILLVSGFILNTLYLLGRGWLGGVFIANSVVEGPFFLPLCMVIIALA